MYALSLPSPCSVCVCVCVISVKYDAHSNAGDAIALIRDYRIPVQQIYMARKINMVEKHHLQEERKNTHFFLFAPQNRCSTLAHSLTRGARSHVFRPVCELTCEQVNRTHAIRSVFVCACVCGKTWPPLCCARSTSQFS